MANPINLNNAPVGQTITVQGTVQYSRIGSLIEGEELQQRNANSKSMYPKTKPYVSITLNEARVNQLGDQPSVGEQWVAHNLYNSSAKNAVNPCYNLEATTNYPPRVFQRTDKDTVVPVDMQGQELAQGLHVTLVTEVYSAGRNNGHGLDIIIVEEPVRFYVKSGDGNSAATLAKLGLVIDNSAAPITPQGQDQQQGAQAPGGQAQQPQQAPQDQMYNTQNQGGMPMPAPNMQPAPQGQQQGQMQPQFNNQSAFGGQPQQPQQPAQQSQPSATEDPWGGQYYPQGGINYNA